MDNSYPSQVQQSAEIPSQSLPSVSPPSSKSSFLLILGGLVLLVIGITGGIFIGKNLSSSKTDLPASYISSVSPTSYLLPTNPPSPPPDPSANWKTYISETGKLSFKYPPSYEIDETGTDDIHLEKKEEDIVTPKQPRLPRTGIIANADDLFIEISFERESGKKTVQEYTDDRIRSTRESAGVFEVSNKTNINIDGIEGVRYLWNQPERLDGEGENVEFVYKGNAIHIYKFPQKTSRQDLFDQILSSFKFL